MTPGPGARLTRAYLIALVGAVLIWTGGAVIAALIVWRLP